MALQINLFHEIHQKTKERQRDPVKLVWLLSILLAVLLVCHWSYRTSVVGCMESHLAALQADWDRLRPQQAAAKAREVELFSFQKADNALVERLQGRFLWAPVLQEIGEAVPADVQITSLAGEVPANKGPITVVMSGVTAGKEPRTVAEDFRLALQRKLSSRFNEVSATFDANSLEESSEMLQIGAQSLPMADFKIRLCFKAEPPGTTPPPSRKATTRVRKKPDESQ